MAQKPRDFNFDTLIRSSRIPFFLQSLMKLNNYMYRKPIRLRKKKNKITCWKYIWFYLSLTLSLLFALVPLPSLRAFGVLRLIWKGLNNFSKGNIFLVPFFCVPRRCVNCECWVNFPHEILEALNFTLSLCSMEYDDESEGKKTLFISDIKEEEGPQKDNRHSQLSKKAFNGNLVHLIDSIVESRH